MSDNKSSFNIKYSIIFFVLILYFNYTESYSVNTDINLESNEIAIYQGNDISKPEEAFSGAFSECILYLSYTCLQKKVINYLIKLEEQDEFPILGKYVTFVKMHGNQFNDTHNDLEDIDDQITPSTKLANKIDNLINNFFNTHVLRVRYGKNSQEDINIGKVVDIVEGRKKTKGESNNGDSGKKKMMMMAMMMMKMKMMMIMPAMMGMMGMMSLKGVLLGGISLLISKILLIMKLMGGMGGKGGPGGGQHGSNDSGWMMNTGGGWNAGQDTQGGGGGSGYNAHGEWQSRSGRDAVKIPQYHHQQDILKLQRRRRNVDHDHFEGRKKKKQRKETISSYMKGMKDAVENNVWD